MSRALSPGLDEWQRQFAKSFAAAVPLTPIRARDPVQWSFDQVHALRLESQPDSERFKALSEALEVLRAARSE